MSGDTKPRSVLSELKRPLLQSAGALPPGVEEHLLGRGPSRNPPPAPVSSEPAPVRRPKAPTIPVTFHLPVDLRDRLKVTAQAKQRTMLDLAVEALSEYMSRNPVTEQDLRRMLGI